MKISSGWSKGLKILTPAGLETRPTRERVRQASINMMQPWIPGARVLDLFAGSGAVGIELVSRGAKGGVFVEMAQSAASCLKSNMAEAEGRAVKQGIPLSPWLVVVDDVYRYLNLAENESFELIWADPPYEMTEEFLTKCPADLRRILASGGVFTLESGPSLRDFLQRQAHGLGLETVKQRVYGASMITVWRKS